MTRSDVEAFARNLENLGRARAIARRAGIHKRVGPHTLRHAFITAALDAGVPRRDVQEAARHADPRTTMRYDRTRVSLDRHATYIVSTFIWRIPMTGNVRYALIGNHLLARPVKRSMIRSVFVAVSLLGATAGCSSATPQASDTTTGPATSEVTTSAPTTTAAHPSLSSPATHVGLDPNPIRVTVAAGCPASVGGHADYGSTSAEWIDNPDVANLADTFVPGEPTSALICRYAALDATTPLPDGKLLDSGDLFSSTTLPAADAVRLASTINAIVPWDWSSGCSPPADKARYTAIAFAIPGRSDVDVWLKDWYNCPELGNGQRTSGLLINGQGSDALAELNALASAAPQRDFIQS